MRVTVNDVEQVVGLDGNYYVNMPMAADETVFIDVDESDSGLVIVNNHVDAEGKVTFRQGEKCVDIPGGGADFRLRFEQGCVSIPIKIWSDFISWAASVDNNRLDAIETRLSALETAGQL